MTDTFQNQYRHLQMLTLSVVGDVNVFTEKCYLDIIVDNLRYCQKERALQLYAYCLLSNKAYLLAAQPSGLMPKVLANFKSYTAKQIISLITDKADETRKDWLLHMFRFHAKFNSGYKEYHFWERDNNPIPLNDPAHVNLLIQEIHNKPVEAGLVSDASHWLYSSAHTNGPLIINSITNFSARC